MSAKCKGCGQPILWRYTPNMRKMPLDVGTIGTPLLGAYVVVNDEDCRPVDPLFEDPGTEYHMSHFVTCGKADQFKAKGNRS